MGAVRQDEIKRREAIVRVLLDAATRASEAVRNKPITNNKDRSNE